MINWTHNAVFDAHLLSIAASQSCLIWKYFLPERNKRKNTIVYKS